VVSRLTFFVVASGISGEKTDGYLVIARISVVILVSQLQFLIKCINRELNCIQEREYIYKSLTKDSEPTIK